MPLKKRQELYDIFSTGNKPTHDDFVDLIDSVINIEEDGIGATEVGSPMEFVEKGENKRLLDFSSSKNNQVWRLSAQGPEPHTIKGFNISSFNNNNDLCRLFIKWIDGCVGINTGNPDAQLHVKAENEDVIKVEDNANEAALLIERNGNTTIGSASTSSAHVLTINSSVDINKAVEVTEKITADNGLDVNNAGLNATAGLTVTGDGTVSGMLTAQNGLTVNGTSLDATNGATISGDVLTAKSGLTVSGDTTFETGQVEAKQGITISGIDVTGNALSVSGKTVIQTGLLEAQDGLTVSSGTLQAQDGVTVSGGAFNAQLGAYISGGSFSATEGAQISGGSGLAVEDGLTVEGTTTITNPSTSTAVFTIDTSNNKISIPAAMDFDATGEIILGNNSANGSVTVDGALTAKSGINIENGDLTITTGDATVTGLMTANGGIIIPETQTLAANGTVNLGNNSSTDPGTVTASGELHAENGLIVENKEITARSGITIESGNLSITSGNATVEGILTANGGIYVSVDNSFEALGDVTLGNDSETEPVLVVANGEFRATKGANLLGQNSTLLNVDDGTSITGTLSVDTVTVTDSFSFDEITTVNALSTAIPTTGSGNASAIPTEDAVKTYVDNELAEKADKNGSDTENFTTNDLTVTGNFGFNATTTINQISTSDTLTEDSDSVIATQSAVKSYVDNELATKANIQKLMTGTSLLNTHTQTFDIADIDADSHGMLLVYIDDSITQVSGIFSIIGTDIIVKTSGDDLSTYDFSHNGTNFQVTNNSGSDVSITITFIGS